MGFFSELKEDLSQAVNELMPEDTVIQRGSVAKTEPTPDFAAKVSLEEMLENIDNVKISDEESVEAEVDLEAEPLSIEPENLHVILETAMETQEEVIANEEIPAEEANREVIVEDGALGQTDVTMDLESELRATFGDEEEVLEVNTSGENILEERAFEENTLDSNPNGNNDVENELDEVAYISGTMTINGDVDVEGALYVAGTINGNVNVSGKLTVTGQIIGAVSALEIYTEGAKIKGEVCGVNAVQIGKESVIKGNISSNSAAVAGAVKGDIDVTGPVILDGSAIVVGNIKSKSVQINNGAVIEGMCSQCYADVSPVTFFDE